MTICFSLATASCNEIRDALRDDEDLQKLICKIDSSAEAEMVSKYAICILTMVVCLLIGIFLHIGECYLNIILEKDEYQIIN